MFKKLLIGITLFLCTLAAQAQEFTEYTVQTVPNPRTIDSNANIANPDGVLEPNVVNALQTIADSLYATTGVELVTVVVNSIGYADAFDFAYNLFNLWGIGDAEKNTGVLVFMSMEYHDIWIITGGGLEGLLPDATCSDIVYGTMIPVFRKGNYGAGLIQGELEIYDKLTTDAALAELLMGYQPEPVSESPFRGLSIISLIVLICTLLIHWMQPRCPNCKKKGSTKKDEIINGSTYAAAGNGIHHYTCSHCGHKWDVPYTIPKKVPYSQTSSGRSGGGYRSSGGSFGGGRSFGGGAGGRW